MRVTMQVETNNCSCWAWQELQCIPRLNGCCLFGVWVPLRESVVQSRAATTHVRFVDLGECLQHELRQATFVKLLLEEAQLVQVS